MGANDSKKSTADPYPVRAFEDIDALSSFTHPLLLAYNIRGRVQASL